VLESTVQVQHHAFLHLKKSPGSKAGLLHLGLMTPTTNKIKNTTGNSNSNSVNCVSVCIFVASLLAPFLCQSASALLVLLDAELLFGIQSLEGDQAEGIRCERCDRIQ